MDQIWRICHQRDYKVVLACRVYTTDGNGCADLHMVVNKEIAGITSELLDRGPRLL